jgi:hypothetical protein
MREAQVMSEVGRALPGMRVEGFESVRAGASQAYALALHTPSRERWDENRLT